MDRAVPRSNLAERPADPRETEVLLAVADGLTSQEIALKLHMSQRTVETHITAVQAKLQAENRLQALCKAVNLGLINPVYSFNSEHLLWIMLVGSFSAIVSQSPNCYGLSK